MAVLPIAATISLPSSGSNGAGNSLTFHGWSGWVPALNQELDTHRRLGQDATTAQATGKASNKIDVTAYRYESSATKAISFCTTVESLPSPTPYKVVTPWGRTLWIRIHESSCQVVKGRGPVDGTTQTTHQITVTMTVERMPDA